MANFETDTDQEISYWVQGFQATPAQKWSLHVPFYYPKDGGRISPELLASVGAVHKVYPLFGKKNLISL